MFLSPWEHDICTCMFVIIATIQNDDKYSPEKTLKGTVCFKTKLPHSVTVFKLPRGEIKADKSSSSKLD